MLGKAQRLKGITIKKVAPVARQEQVPIAKVTIEPLPLPAAEPIKVPELEPEFVQPELAPPPEVKKTGRKITVKKLVTKPIPVTATADNWGWGDEPVAPAPVQTGPAPAADDWAWPTEVAPAMQTTQAPAVKTGRKLTIRKKLQLTEEQQKYKTERDSELAEDPYVLPTDKMTFLPATRLAFQNFMRTKFTPFAITSVPPPDYEACAKLGQRGDAMIERFLYQQFVREYLRQETPYRGVLVYHGLGSGKTCTSIAAAEALFGRSNKKIIVMTPGALRTNFQAELTSCGFRHHSLQNHWVFMPLTETTKMFAKDVLGIKSGYFWSDLEKEPAPQQGIYIPDFDKPNNYSALPAWQQTGVRRQLKAQLEGRITFLSYNSARDTSRKRLQDIACNDPTFFDNAVIVIDEIHNVTRLMCRKMDKEILERLRRGKNDPAFDPITSEPWKPLVCSTPYNHSRAYLLYRLLATARNTKIIGLSGTPLINFPEEVAILANLLGGYIHTIESTVPVTQTAEDDLIAIARGHPRIDFVDVQKAELKVKILYSILPEKYKKVFDEKGMLKGVEYDPEAVTTPAEVHAEFNELLKPKNLSLSVPIQKSYPLLPPTKDDFYRAFIKEEDLSLTNTAILRRRLQGLISYYRGSKVDLMPSIKEDMLIRVPMSEYAYSVYERARQEEIRSGAKKTVAQDMDELDGATNPAYYRFRSRSACNFAFPADIERPFPTSKKATQIDVGSELPEDLVYTEADTAVTAEELADRIREEGEGGDEAAAAPTLEISQMRTYAEKLEYAKAKLYERREDLLALTGDVNKGLDKFSPKMAAILRKIDELDEIAETFMENGVKNFYGPHLIYSQFITMEGLGILGMAMEANGYVPIEFEGPFEALRFSQRTLESLEKGPEAKEGRFMFFTSNSSIRERDVLLNIFNGRFDKLPEGIKSVLVKHYDETRNKRGEICKVFGLGAAGAEGISLKNVRAVHIMEPYWNSVRTDQVKGRAIRICSHMELPIEHRNVRVYTYCASLELKISEALKIHDEGLTSDEYINVIATKKKNINQGILDIMKEVAVDCVLNQLENQDAQCFIPKAQSNESFAYHPDIEVDLRNPPHDVAATTVAPVTVQKIVEIKGLTNTEKAKTIIAAETKAAAVGAPSRPGVEKAPVVTIRGKEYIMIAIPKKDNMFELFDKDDALKTRPLGLLKRDPMTGKFAVKMAS